MSVPGWWAAVLLALAAWRTFRLVAFDTVLDRPRRWLVMLPREWRQGDPVSANYRLRIAEFIECPFCAGFWIAAGWWGAWQLWPHAATWCAVPFALSAAVALIETRLG